ncbi:hypothetical protein CWR53_01945 [Pseudomonas sp. SGAir0191]|uniref:hypothetical protein n=1 Tax=Pseudomonas sp. SGAir0191 TaxID=2217867 RepID=UPI000C2B7057|nr:hypothetical protein [Pseudomonas sp. SGAir0191]AUA31441.1 hypothetical protein CWR53_01945 [Pseudomonas sp. SGAir0191]
MKASIKFDNTVTPLLHGDLGIINAPYTAVLEITKPDGTIDNLVVPSSGNTTWSMTLNLHTPGDYDARIRPREAGAFESTRVKFKL